MATSRHIIEETIDAVLQQQLLSSSYRVLDRVQKRALLVPGTKAAFRALKSAIMDLVPVEARAIDLPTLAEHLAREFHVAKTDFDAKLASLPPNDPSVDARLQLVMLLSVLREHWQNDAYELVIAEIREMALRRGCDAACISRDALNRALSSRFGPAFSHLVNLYVIRTWGQITGVPIKIRSARMTVLNSLVASVVRMVQKGDPLANSSDQIHVPPVPGLPPPPDLPGPR